jgi:hypothetical protein
MWGLIGLGASLGLGALFGSMSTRRQSKKEQEQLRHQKETAWSQYLLGQEYSDTQFSLQRNEANSQLNIQEDRLNQGVTQGVAEFNTGLLGQAYGIQDAQIQTSGGIGASLAAEAASGTRGSSGGGLMRDYAQQSLDRNIALQGQQNDQALAGMLSQAGNSLQDIGRERESWQDGGYNYESKIAQDAYNRDLAELGQSDFDWRISAAKATTEDYLMGMFGGASSLLSFGESAAGFVQSFAGVGKGRGLYNGPYDNIGYGQAGRGYTNNGMSTDWRTR